MCSEASLCTAWDGSVSSSRLLNPPVDIWCLEDEWFYTSHSIRKQNLLESCITGFTRISSFSESTCSFSPSNYHLNFPICSSLCTMQTLGPKGLSARGLGSLGMGWGGWSPFADLGASLPKRAHFPCSEVAASQSGYGFFLFLKSSFI